MFISGNAKQSIRSSMLFAYAKLSYDKIVYTKWVVIFSIWSYSHDRK